MKKVQYPFREWKNKLDMRDGCLYNEVLSYALQGEGCAQYFTAKCCAEGLGTSKNEKEALKWFTAALKSAQEYDSNPLAQFVLGDLHSSGVPFLLEQNASLAATYLSKSANQKEPCAQYRLGLMYYDGDGVAQNNEQALRLIEEAASAGLVAAECTLGFLYDSGEGIDRNFDKAVRWYSLAATKGYSKAQSNLAAMYWSGEGVEQSYEKAAEWYTKAALQGDADAQHCLGLLYISGKGVKKNEEKALTWIETSAKENNTNSVDFFIFNPAFNDLLFCHNFPLGFTRLFPKCQDAIITMFCCFDNFANDNVTIDLRLPEELIIELCKFIVLVWPEAEPHDLFYL